MPNRLLAVWGAVLARLLLGALFATSAVDKLTDLPAFEAAVRGYGFSGLTATAITALVPWMEAALALCLLAGLFTSAAALAALLLLSAFLILFIVNWGQTLPAGCGCFPWEDGFIIVGPYYVVRTLLLMAVAAFVALRGGGGILELDRRIP